MGGKRLCLHSPVKNRITKMDSLLLKLTISAEFCQFTTLFLPEFPFLCF